MQQNQPMRRRRYLMIMASLSIFVMANRAAAVDLVAYIPDYRMTSASYVQNVLPRQIALLDEVRYFGITVNSNGSGALTTNSTHLANIQTISQIIAGLPADKRPRLDIALGGWQMSAGFSTIVADANKRTVLAQNISALLNQTGATSVDFDWEHPSGSTELNNYAAMLQRTKQEVGATRRVYATVEPTKFVPTSVFTGENAIDGISLMTYDIGWWANDAADPNRGEHSLPQYAEDSLDAWTDPVGTPNLRTYVFPSWGKSAPVDKLGIGLPFYGRTIGTAQSPASGDAVAYSQLATGGTTTDGNYYTYQGNTYWVPGPDIVEQRVQFAHERGLKNIIIWELQHDLDPDNPNSLLRTAYEAKQSLIAVAGDYDGDRNVDHDDFVAWAASFGLTGGLLADGNYDGTVDAADYAVWRDAMTTAGGGAVASTFLAVPEPSNLSLLAALGGLSVAFRSLSRN